MLLGMCVVGNSGKWRDEVCHLDFDTAVEQYRVFKKAGYRDVSLVPTYFVMDVYGEYHVVTAGNPIAVAEHPIPARYSRADLNPGISVYDYDRDVLKRGISFVEGLISVAVSLLLFGGSIAAFMRILRWLVGPLELGYGLLVCVLVLTGFAMIVRRWFCLCLQVGEWFVGHSEK
ncbi:MAG: hypothetical protein UX70_C0001G0353 [Candidatus Wolfebacteria bacterium GW2011_GWB1_47_1]|nr:MAG: hypothetical protein UX70_C0001G0353 [Candidatus Wolfebacteria bacterium GW2011_GWB1_47_1]